MTETLKARMEQALAVEWEDGVGATCALNVLWPLVEAEIAALTEAQTWQPIKTAPRETEVFFWVRPKTADETYVDTSGKPIVSHAPARLHRGRWKSWSALEIATHWMPLPSAPASVPPAPAVEHPRIGSMPDAPQPEPTREEWASVGVTPATDGVL